MLEQIRQQAEREVAEAIRAGEARDGGVSIAFAPTKELSVDGDPEQLRQVMWNLIRNALQATPPGGRVLLDVFEQIRQGWSSALRNAIICQPNTDVSPDSPGM